MNGCHALQPTVAHKKTNGTAAPAIDSLLYGPSGVMYGNNAFDNLERQGTTWNFTGNQFSWKPKEFVGSSNLVFGSEAKSIYKLQNQMNSRGWSDKTVRTTVDSVFITRPSINMATGNPSTAYFNKDGSYVVVDNITHEVVQVSNRFDPDWIPDPNISNPYLP